MFADANISSGFARIATIATVSLCAVLAGCGVTVRGDGRATDTTPHGSQAVAASISATAPTAPLDAAGVDPCALLTTDTQDGYGVTDHTRADVPDIDAAICKFVVDDDMDFRVTVADGLTLDKVRTVLRQQGRQDTTTQVRGLEAAVSWSPAEPENCIAAVAVSPTGIVAVSYRDSTATVADQDGVCGRARDIAAASIDGLPAAR